MKTTLDYVEFAGRYFSWITAILSLPAYWIYLFIKNIQRGKRC